MPDVEIVELVAQPTAVVRATVPWSQLKDVFDSGFKAVFSAAAEQGVPLAGPPFGYYPVAPGEQVTVELGAPVAGEFQAAGEVAPGQLPGGRAVRTVHVGPYDALPDTYEALRLWMAEADLTPATGMWEVYVDDPSATSDPGTLRTEIYWLLAD